MSSTQLSESKKIECKEVFLYFDQDNDGFLSSEDLDNALKALGLYIPSEELKKMMSSSKNGKINFDEFLNMIKGKLSQTVNKAELIDAFSFLDKSKTGFCDAIQLKRALMTLGEPLQQKEVDALLKSYINQDQKVPYKNFINGMVAK